MEPTKLESLLDELGHEVRYHEHRERLKEEIAAHAEDAAYEAMLAGVPEAERERHVITRLGSAKNIARSYNDYMKYRRLFAIFTEGLLLGLIGSVPYLFFLSGLNSFVFHYPNHRVLAIAFSVLFGTGVLVVAQVILSVSITSYLDNTLKKIVFFAGLMVPVFMMDASNLLVSAPWLYYVLASGISVYTLTDPRTRSRLSELGTGRAWYRFIPYAVVVGGLVFIVSATATTYYYFSTYNVFLGTFLGFFSKIMPLHHVGGLKNVMNTYGVGSFLIFFLFLCSVSIIRNVREKTLPAFKILVAAFLLSIFFVATPRPLPRGWQVPVKDVSTAFEREKTTIFFPLVELLRSTGYGYPFYTLFPDGLEKDLLIHDHESVFKLVVGKTIEDARLEPTVVAPEVWSRNTENVRADGAVVLDKRFTCVDTSGLENNGLVCTSLYFKNKLIFSQKNPLLITGLQVSADEKLLVLIERHLFFPRETVYLVSLE